MIHVENVEKVEKTGEEKLEKVVDEEKVVEVEQPDKTRDERAEYGEDGQAHAPVHLDIVAEHTAEPTGGRNQADCRGRGAQTHSRRTSGEGVRSGCPRPYSASQR